MEHLLVGRVTVMGNHEFNAIAYNIFDGAIEDFLRPHSEKSQKQHHALLPSIIDKVFQGTL
jgi:hypothetical protein